MIDDLPDLFAELEQRITRQVFIGLAVVLLIGLIGGLLFLG